MASFLPFRAVRPRPDLAAEVAALPYDTMSTPEARAAVRDLPLSFLHIDKAQINLPPGGDHYGDIVYQTAAAWLQAMRQNGQFVQDSQAQFYIYRQTWRGRTQTGLVGCASVDDYQNNVIKKHETTRASKEEDRIRHVSVCNAHTGPIFLLFEDSQSLAGAMARWCEAHPPETSFEGPGGALQQIWPVTDAALAQQWQAAFAQMPALYIADGHHRCASAVAVGLSKREAEPGYSGDEAYNHFLAVAFPHEELQILPYNRVVRDLNGHSNEAFLQALQTDFAIELLGAQATEPQAPHELTMLLGGLWYRLRVKPSCYDASDPVGALDVEILQQRVLAPLLGIHDPRRSERIAFIGGVRGLAELERRCADDCQVAFALFPVTTAALMRIADGGQIMPPKSTWFEPKLLSGLFVHLLS